MPMDNVLDPSVALVKIVRPKSKSNNLLKMCRTSKSDLLKVRYHKKINKNNKSPDALRKIPTQKRSVS